MVTMLRSRLTEMAPRLGGGGKRPGSVGIRWAGRKLQQWRARILRAEPLCRHCKAKGQLTIATEVDHETPLEQGGTYADANAQPLCAECHKVKSKAEAQARAKGYRTATGDATLGRSA